MFSGIKSKISLLSLSLLPSSAFALGGLSKAKGFFETLQTELLTVIPVVAAIALLILAVGYANNMIDKKTLYNWVIGIIIAGSATEVVALFFS